MYLALFKERNALLSFLFHSLFRDEQEIEKKLVDPLQRTTVAKFRQFIEYYLRSGYQFISPADLVNGVSPQGKYALITFDDGYFNNELARPILEEYKVPAVFFISTEHVKHNKCFWWDVIYRERAVQGLSHRKIYREQISMKAMTTEQIEARLTDLFGADAFRPRGDIDRPFTPAELREFASSKYVHLGNHTANHAILTNYTREQVRDQITRAQDSLRLMTGVNPCAIAYPNGAHSSTIIETCSDVGLKVGFTVRPEKSTLPMSAQPLGLFRLGRFAPHGDGSIVSQCRTYRSDLLLYSMFRDGYLKLARKNAMECD